MEKSWAWSAKELIYLYIIKRESGIVISRFPVYIDRLSYGLPVKVLKKRHPGVGGGLIYLKCFRFSVRVFLAKWILLLMVPRGSLSVSAISWYL